MKTLERSHLENIEWTRESVYIGLSLDHVEFDTIGSDDAFSLGDEFILDAYVWVVTRCRSERLALGGARDWHVRARREE